MREIVATGGKPADTLLIYPPTGLYRRDHRCQNRVNDQTVRVVTPPIDLAYMASFLREAGIESAVEDYPAQGRGIEELFKDIAGPLKFLVMKSTSSSLKDDAAICRRAKELNRELKVILFAAPTPAESPAAEMASVFDGVIHEEWQLPALIENLSSGSENAPKQIDFRDYPLPARDLLKNELYRLPVSDEAMTVIQSARGCVHQCIFCPAPFLYKGAVQQRPVESVAEELHQCVEDFHIPFILFDADTFTLNRDWVMNLCDAITAQGLYFSWGANSRVDTVDSEMLARMKKAGCRVLGFGVESGDESMLEKMKKDTDIPRIKRAFNNCAEAGILSHAFFTIGLPWENRETLQKTLALARELNPDLFDVNIVLPLPGSRYEAMAKSEGLFEGGLNGAGYSDSPVRSRHLSHDELVAARKRMLLKLYFRPAYILRTFKKHARSPGRFLRLIVYGFRRVAGLV